MNFLGRFFGRHGSVEADIYKNSEKIIRLWGEYLGTIAEKERLINESPINFRRLQELINTELVDIKGEKVSEEELVMDLEEVEHDYKIKKIHRLEDTLYRIKKKHEYIYNLVSLIFNRLKNETHLLNKIIKGPADKEKLAFLLKKEIELEIEVINKVKKFNEIAEPGLFNKCFRELLRGEHIIKNIESKKDKLFHEIERKIAEQPDSIIYKWVDAVYAKVEDKVHELEENGELMYHPNVLFEFVNSPAFVDFAREVIKSISPFGASERNIEIVVYLFRDMYNHRDLD